MTIDEAIRINNLCLAFLPKGTDIKYKVAIKLGIEALKVISGTRQVGSVIISPLLPGETKD